MSGGPSHVELFDPKPRLAADYGKPLPFAMPKLDRTKTGNLLGSPFKFSKHGQSRHRSQRAVSECRQACRRPVRHPLDGRGQHQPQRRLPADEHRRAGVLAAEPRARGCSMAWAARTRTCPASWSSVQRSPRRARRSGVRASCRPRTRERWSRDLKNPIANLRNDPTPTSASSGGSSTHCASSTSCTRSGREDDSRLSGPDRRRSSWRSACRREAPEAFDVDGETRGDAASYTASTRRTTEIFGTQCLMARRLVERGVRCVQVYHTQTSEAVELPVLGPARRLADRTARQLSRPPISRSPAC